MFNILLLWIIVFFICYTLGKWILTFAKVKNFSEISATIIGWSGLIVVTNVISLFCPVNRRVLFLLMVVAILRWLLMYYLMPEKKLHLWDNMHFFCWWKLAIAVALFVFFVILTFAFIEQEGDTLAYHAQSVRWINEYGVVKGIANLMNKVGFNNSIFCFYSLGVDGVTGVKCHSMQGFIMWIFATYFILTAVSCIKERRYDAGVYSLFVFAYIVRNAAVGATYLTDYPANCLVAFILCEWMLTSSEDVKRKCLLCVVTAVLVTVKLSTAPVLLLSLDPIIRLTKAKEFGKIVLCSATCFFVGLPYFIRNFFVSGWLLFPSTTIDLFDVEWKVPKYYPDLQAKWIYSWGRIPKAGFDKTMDGSLFSWVPQWVINQNALVKLMMLLIILGALYVIAIVIKSREQERLFPYMIVWVCLAYWFCSAPDVRFVMTMLLYVLWLPFEMILSMPERYMQIVIAIIVIASGRHLLNFISFFTDLTDINEMLLGNQEEFRMEEVSEEEYIGDVTIYHISLPGNHELPCRSLGIEENIRLLGDSIEDGFAAE